MKREILFRGKRIDNGEWIYGNIQVPKPPFDKWFMWDKNHCQQQVYSETVGQFTGKTQSSNHPMFDDSIRLWEDDIFMVEKINTKYRVVVENFEWIGVSNEGDDWGKYKYRLSAIGKSCIRIIGNIHDNPELL